MRHGITPSLQPTRRTLRSYDPIEHLGHGILKIQILGLTDNAKACPKKLKMGSCLTAWLAPPL
eukprot:6035444-Karenia_brevis.AAC.1